MIMFVWLCVALLHCAALARADLLGDSGYVQTNRTSGAHLFWWFFPAPKAMPNAPVILWVKIEEEQKN